MEASYGNIIGKHTDYKICTDCSAYNWYENETCHSCCSEPANFEPMTEKHVKELTEELVENHIDDEDSLCIECTTEI